jgi:single-strand DNA-binding protein
MSSAVTIIGNLTSDPDMKTTKTGGHLLNFSVAVNRRWRNKQDQWEEETSFFDCTAWNELAENISASVGKGSRVIVTGRLEQQSWEKDGKNHSKIVLVAEDCGPSLRKAQVSGVTKINQKTQPMGQKAPLPSFDDEEPF